MSFVPDVAIIQERGNLGIKGFGNFSTCKLPSCQRLFQPWNVNQPVVLDELETFIDNGKVHRELWSNGQGYRWASTETLNVNPFEIKELPQKRSVEYLFLVLLELWQLCHLLSDSIQLVPGANDAKTIRWSQPIRLYSLPLLWHLDLTALITALFSPLRFAAHCIWHEFVDIGL